MDEKIQFKFNEVKFSEILHYIISKTSNKYNFGKVKLYKTLYFADFNFFEKYEKLITNETYIKIKFGPAPKHFDSVIKKLKENKMIKEEIKYFNDNKKLNSFISLKEPKINLTFEEKQEIDTAIDLVSSMSATQISAYSHDDTPWKVSKLGEDLDPMLVFYRDEKYSVTSNGESESKI